MMQAGARHGMRTMDQSLANLVKSGHLSFELAVQQCHDPNEVARLAGKPLPGVSDA